MTDSAVPQSVTLPGLLAEITAAAGLDAALAIAKSKGGTIAYFPARPKPEHWLSQLVGHTEALAIGAAVAPAKSGIEMLVPIGPSAVLERRAAILEMKAAGLSANTIARELGIHSRTVKKHISSGVGHD